MHRQFTRARDPTEGGKGMQQAELGPSSLCCITLTEHGCPEENICYDIVGSNGNACCGKMEMGQTAAGVDRSDPLQYGDINNKAAVVHISSVSQLLYRMLSACAPQR